MSWNYRLIHKRDVFPGGGTGDYFGVHEVYYDDAGNVMHWTERAVGVSGETVKEAQQVRIRMLEAWHQPTLEWDELVRVAKAKRRADRKARNTKILKREGE